MSDTYINSEDHEGRSTPPPSGGNVPLSGVQAPAPAQPQQPSSVRPFGSNPHGTIDRNGQVHGM